MKTLIVYVHLLAACVAVGILLLQDSTLAKTLGRALSNTAVAELSKAAGIIFAALVLLWVSGLALVVLGYLEDPQHYLFNEKLWAKFSVVSVLTLNGIALHYFSFPRVTCSRGLLGRSVLEQSLVVFTGALSSVSWLYACFLGVARAWNHTMDYTLVMTIYACLFAAALIVGLKIMHALRDTEPPLLTQRVHTTAKRRTSQPTVAITKERMTHK